MAEVRVRRSTSVVFHKHDSGADYHWIEICIEMRMHGIGGIVNIYEASNAAAAVAAVCKGLAPDLAEGLVRWLRARVSAGMCAVLSIQLFIICYYSTAKFVGTPAGSFENRRPPRGMLRGPPFEALPKSPEA